MNTTQLQRDLRRLKAERSNAKACNHPMLANAILHRIEQVEAQIKDAEEKATPQTPAADKATG